MGPIRGRWTGHQEGIRRIKSQDGPDLILWSGSTLTSTLLEHGLADEVLLLVNPVLVGTGKRFFAEGTPARSFKLVSTSATPSGIIASTYKAAGPLKTGWFGMLVPSCDADFTLLISVVDREQIRATSGPQGSLAFS
jgi:hypothetical protein